ncbi:MAG: AAA family ATPase [Lachnospiraceae bacterium]|jgi:AAA+ ATPase superfamily predicted ATPase|nr:AAA family ATPase [Lachnospiraceae bacterium]
MGIVARDLEIKSLREWLGSDQSEFVAVYGRRRIGKTFLVREVLSDRFAFYVTGQESGGRKEQLAVFNRALNISATDSSVFAQKDSWLETFWQLEDLIRNHTDTRKKVIFIDEMPWLDTPKSGFMSGLEYFWNSFASARKDVMLIACGSSSSWLIENLFENTGGLFNRITQQLKLPPFTLSECEQLFKHYDIRMTRYQIIQSYMIFGGIPHYMSRFRKEYSLAQNVDALCFANDAPMKNEYKRLLSTLFRNDAHYDKLLHTFAAHPGGRSRDDLTKATGLSGGQLTGALEKLEECDFIRRYHPFGKKKKDTLWQLMDPFVLFHHRFIRDGTGRDANYWTRNVQSSLLLPWSGFAFERVCLWHSSQIRDALGLGGVSIDVCAWRGDGAQVDLILDRSDMTVNLIEIKFSISPYRITGAYMEKLRTRLTLFVEQTGTRKALHTTLLTTFGLAANEYSGEIQSSLTLEDLFRH